MSRLGDHKGKESFDIADKKFEKRPNMSGDAVVYQRKANTSGGSTGSSTTVVGGVEKMWGNGQSTKHGWNPLPAGFEGATFARLYYRTAYLHWNEGWAMYYYTGHNGTSYTSKIECVYSRGAGDGTGSVRHSGEATVPIFTKPNGETGFYVTWGLFGAGPSSTSGTTVYTRSFIDVNEHRTASTNLPSVPTPLNGNKIAEGGNGTHKKTVDITQYGIPANSGVRWGSFIYIQDGKFTKTQIITHGTTDWTQGNQVARVDNPDKYQHGFTQQFIAPVINDKCYIQVHSQDDDVWQLYFAGVI